MKPPEVLTRDRLLASYEVKPVLDKLRQTLLGAGLMLLTSALLLGGLIHSDANEDGVYGELHLLCRLCWDLTAGSVDTSMSDPATNIAGLHFESAMDHRVTIVATANLTWKAVMFCGIEKLCLQPQPPSLLL